MVDSNKIIHSNEKLRHYTTAKVFECHRTHSHGKVCTHQNHKTLYNLNGLLHVRQRSLERQLARRAANVHLLGVLGDGPVLCRYVPVGQVTAGEGSRPHHLLSRSKVDTVKVAQNNHGLVGATKRDILHRS